jgi:hypothetical protein
VERRRAEEEQALVEEDPPRALLKPLVPIRLSTLDMVLLQHHAAIPTTALVTMGQVIAQRDGIAEAQRSREAWKANSIAMTNFAPRLGVYDKGLADILGGLRKQIADFYGDVEALERELERPTKFVEYYRQAGRLEP